MTDQHDALHALYQAEQARLMELADTDDPQGAYAEPVFGEGDTAAPLALLIGEAPGAEETRQGRPFVGKAGQQLDALLAEAAVARESIYITNVVKYRPVVRNLRTTRNRTPNRHEVEGALPLLRAQIGVLKPRWIVTMGNTPLTAVLLLAGEKPCTVGEAHGRERRLCINGHACSLFPLFHPASGIYNRSLIDVMRFDARRLGEHLVKRD